ncbi:ATP-dependent RNA helicase vasa-like isoform X3 [Artemia franciscana]|uniref:ATP-dependent RNA helicase vasa-like isoform X3 n=1 Tax=Artemia franciscana TaxID=6661 RepID=UPI0032DAC767
MIIGLNCQRTKDIGIMKPTIKLSKLSLEVTGEDLPSGIDSFDPARWRSIILANIKKSGYTQPTPVQKWAIPVILKKRDLMACAETGSGKPGCNERKVEMGHDLRMKEDRFSKSVFVGQSFVNRNAGRPQMR